MKLKCAVQTIMYASPGICYFQNVILNVHPQCQKCHLDNKKKDSHGAGATTIG